MRDGLALRRLCDAPVMVDNARVVKTDVGASNGIIHVIDAVILPEETK